MTLAEKLAAKRAAAAAPSPAPMILSGETTEPTPEPPGIAGTTLGGVDGRRQLGSSELGERAAMVHEAEGMDKIWSKVLQSFGSQLCVVIEAGKPDVAWISVKLDGRPGAMLIHPLPCTTVEGCIPF